MEDKELIALYFDRNEKAMRHTAEKYGALCHHIAKNILGNDEDAEECVNDAYFAIWNRIPPEQPQSFRAFLSKIVRNISLDRFDYNTAACRNSNTDAVLEEMEAFLPDIHGDFSENIGLMDEINDFLAGQSQAARCVFVRRYFYCDSITEIAKRYDLKESTVKSLLYRVRDRLAKHLKKGGFNI